MAPRVDPSRFKWVTVRYPAALPLSTSIATGVDTAISKIHATPGRFIFVGTSIGAIIASNLYDELRTGRLQDRKGDLIAGLLIGNPRRQAGHTLPGATDPGGRGILQPNLASCASSWWEFAPPGDPASAWVDDDTPMSLWGRDVFADFLDTYTGSVYEVLDRWVNPLVKLSTLATAMRCILAATTTIDADVSAYTPVDSRTALDVAADFINSLVIADADNHLDCVAIPVTADGITYAQARTATTRMVSYATAEHHPRTFRDILIMTREDFPPPWWPKFSVWSWIWR